MQPHLYTCVCVCSGFVEGSSWDAWHHSPDRAHGRGQSVVWRRQAHRHHAGCQRDDRWVLLTQPTQPSYTHCGPAASVCMCACVCAGVSTLGTVTASLAKPITTLATIATLAGQVTTTTAAASGPKQVT